MKDVKKTIKKKGINLIILAILLFLLDLFMFLIVDDDNSITGLLKDRCIINNASDVSKCQKENSYVKVNFDIAYETTYVYQKKDTTVAYYLDLDLEGKSLISLIDKDTAQKLLNKEQKYVEGKLITFTDVDYDALSQIKSYYISEGINADYIGIQFSNYDVNDVYIAIILLIAFTAFILFILIKGIRIVMNPENYQYYKLYKDEIDKINEELNAEYQYQYKGIKISNKYIFIETKFSIKIYYLSDIKWVYQKDFKRYGITVNKVIVINFIDGTNVTIPFKKKDALEHFSNDVLVGYTNENIKKYQKIIKEYKLNHK